MGLNVKTIIPNGLSVLETILEIKKAGGLVVIPHPFGLCCSFDGNLKNIIEHIDAIEVLNANIFKNNNQKALSLAKEHNFAITAGSDAHSSMFVGEAFLEIPGEKLSISQIFEQIKNKRCKPSGKETNIFLKGIAFLQRSWAKIKYYTK